MWRLAKKRIALALAVPALFLLSPGAANADLISFDFTGELTGGEFWGLSLIFDPAQMLAQQDARTQSITYTNVILNFDDREFASVEQGLILQLNGTDPEFFQDTWGFTSVVTEIGGIVTYTVTTQILDPSLSFIQSGIVFTETAPILGLDLTSAFLLQGDLISSTGSIFTAVTRTAIAIVEPATLFLFSIGLAALGLAARRRAS